MRIRTYGVVRGVMLKHPPTRFFCHGNSGNASERAVSVSASAPLGGDGRALAGVTGKAGKACAAGKKEQENLTGKNSKGKKRYGARGRGRTDTESLPRDFKSLVSTNFTTWAAVTVEMEAWTGVAPV